VDSPPPVISQTPQRRVGERKVTRMFEAAGVARTERSIVNWCQHNAQGFGKLDAYYDANERRYCITPQSVELAIKEEQAKAAKNVESSEPVEIVPRNAEGQPSASGRQARWTPAKSKCCGRRYWI